MLTFYKYEREHNNINKLFLKNANAITKKKNVHSYSLTFVRINPSIFVSTKYSTCSTYSGALLLIHVYSNGK